MGVYTAAYLSLVALTGITIAASWLEAGRAAGVTLALAIAFFKAGLIGYYFMHLKQEGVLIWSIVAVGTAAVLILSLGILPDIALKL